MSQPECPSSQALGAFYDGELDAAERDQIRLHVGTCPACSEELAALDQLSDRFAEQTADAVLRPIELARLHQVLDLEMSAGELSSPAPVGGRFDGSLRRTALLVAALAASVLIVASAWLWEIPGSAESGPGHPSIAQAQPWEVAALTLDPLYSNEPVAGRDDTRLAEAPIVNFMLDSVLGRAMNHETN